MGQFISSLNLFQTRLANEESVAQQRLTTRLFIFLMIIAMIVNGTYIFFSIQTQVITIPHPSRETYEQLHHNYSSTISCPCSHISIPYKRFLMIDYILHQICSSTLVSQSWLNFILAYDQSELTYGTNGLFLDFRIASRPYFQLLANVCYLVRNIFDDALNTSKESHYINQFLLSQSKFLEQMLLLNQSLTTSIQQEFLSIQSWLGLMTTHSQLLVGLLTNANFDPDDNSDVIRISDIFLAVYDREEGFSYHQHSLCRQSPEIGRALVTIDFAVINNTEYFVNRQFNEMYAGCVPWLALLLTDTTWWYHTDTINHIRLTFGDNLRNQSDPIIIPLSNQTQTRFRYKNGSHPPFQDILRGIN